MNKGQRRSLKVRRVLLGSGCGLMSFLSLTSTWPRRLSLLFLIYISVCSSQWFSEWESLTNMAIAVCNNGQSCKMLNIWNMKPEKGINDSCCIINYRQNVSLKKKAPERYEGFSMSRFSPIYLFLFFCPFSWQQMCAVWTGCLLGGATHTCQMSCSEL